MMNSETYLKKQSLKISNWPVFAFLAISLIGFADASYLTAKHYLGQTIVCSILEGCEEVLTSQYGVIFDIPVALFGAIYYFTVFVLTIAYLDSRRDKFILFAAYLTSFGFLASLWFLYLQIFVIKAFCLYCLISAFSSTMLFVLGMLVLKKFRLVDNHGLKN